MRAGMRLGVVLLAAIAAAAASAATSGTSVVVKVPVPGANAGKVYVYKVRETLRPGIKKPGGLTLKVLNDKALGNVGAAGGVSKPVVKGRVATYTVLIGVINFGGRRVQARAEDEVTVHMASQAENEAEDITAYDWLSAEQCKDLAEDLHIMVTYYGLRNHAYQPSPAVQVLREAYLRDCP